MKYSILIFLVILSSGYSSGQQLIKAENFVINTSFLEPEERVLSQNLGSEGIIAIAKNKGTSKGTSTYFLEHRRANLSLVWSTPVRIADKENILHLEVMDQQVVLLTVLHNEKQKQTKLHADIYNRADGEHLAEKLLLEHDIKSWNAADDKGAVIRDFNSFILSGSKKGYITPLEYRYNIGLSPDRSLLLIYRYDYSKPNLLAEAFVYDRELTLLKKGTLPIDKGYINHGLSLSPEGNIFILNAKNDGTVAVIYYNLDEKSSQFLEISSSNTDRAHYILQVEGEHHASLSYTNIRGNVLDGISFAKFNFKDEQIDWIHYQELATNLDSLYRHLGESSSKNNFILLDRKSQNGGNFFILEQREFLSSGRNFEPDVADDKDYWKSGKGRVNTGNIFLTFFDDQNVLKWSHLIPKNQTTGSEEGLINTGFNYGVFEESINILFAVGIGTVSQLNHVKIDWNGKITKSELPNEHHIILLRPYTQWLNPHEVVIVGKKGFSGKSSMILKYKIP